MTDIDYKSLGDNYRLFCGLVKELEPCVADILCNSKTDTVFLGDKLRLLSMSVEDMLNAIKEAQFIYSNNPGTSTRAKYEQYKKENLE